MNSENGDIGAISSYVKCSQKDLLLSHLNPNTDMCHVTRKKGSAGRIADRALGGNQKNVDFTMYAMDCFRKPAQMPLGMLCLWMLPQLVHGKMKCSMCLSTYTPPIS